MYGEDAVNGESHRLYRLSGRFTREEGAGETPTLCPSLPRFVA